MIENLRNRKSRKRCICWFTVKEAYGTGSWPWPPQGWQRAILFSVSQPPFNGPYFFIASIPYCEQVGVYRHEGPIHGEITCWYVLIRKTKGHDTICFASFIQFGLKASFPGNVANQNGRGSQGGIFQSVCHIQHFHMTACRMHNPGNIHACNDDQQ